MFLMSHAPVDFFVLFLFYSELMFIRGAPEPIL